jgi:hypothetical protein
LTRTDKARDDCASPIACERSAFRLH